MDGIKQGEEKCKPVILAVVVRIVSLVSGLLVFS